MSSHIFIKYLSLILIRGRVRREERLQSLSISLVFPCQNIGLFKSIVNCLMPNKFGPIGSQLDNDIVKILFFISNVLLNIIFILL